MHIYTYECVECGDEYEVVSENDGGFSPGHFLYCDFCQKHELFVPVEHIEIEHLSITFKKE